MLTQLLFALGLVIPYLNQSHSLALTATPPVSVLIVYLVILPVAAVGDVMVTKI